MAVTVPFTSRPIRYRGYRIGQQGRGWAFDAGPGGSIATTGLGSQEEAEERIDAMVRRVRALDRLSR